MIDKKEERELEEEDGDDDYDSRRKTRGSRRTRGRARRTRRSVDLKTALLNEAGLERNIFYFCRCVVAKARAIYRFSVSVPDYVQRGFSGKGHVIDFSEEYKFTYVPR